MIRLLKLTATFMIALTLGLMTSLVMSQPSTAAPVPRTDALQATSATLITATVPNTYLHRTATISYARIISDDVAVYTSPLALEQGLSPTRTMRNGFLFVSLYNPTPISSSTGLWYQINEEEFVHQNVITYVQGSVFQGTPVITQPELRFGWIIHDTPVLSTPDPEPTPTDILGWPMADRHATENTSFIPRYTKVTIYEYSPLGSWGWYRIGENEWVHLYDVGVVDLKERPAEIPAGDRWVTVDLFDQTMAAYNEQDEMVYATLISSGRQVEGWRTPPGIFQIYKKVKMARMRGGGRSDFYFIEDVQNTLYFHEGYAFHAAYWHDDFGRYKSHGCVNMTDADSEWLFNWATPSTAPLDNITKSKNTDDPPTWVWIYE